MKWRVSVPRMDFDVGFAGADPVLSVRAFLSRYVQSSQRMLVAVSGGEDSVGLFALLTDALNVPAKRLAVGHVDHGLRSDSDEDIELVRQLAASRGVACLVQRVEVTAFAREHGISLEAAARRLRYRALEEMACRANADWILTAHTRDDSAETVLMRLLNKAPWYECTAIPARRGRILRPLIGVFRNDLRNWTRAHECVFREDSTNREIRYVRNYLRALIEKSGNLWTNEFVCRLEESGRTVGTCLEILRVLGTIIPERLPGTVKRVKSGLAIDKIFNYFGSLSFVPVEASWAELSGFERLPSALRQQVSGFLRGKNPEAHLLLPQGFRLLRQGGKVWIYRPMPDVSLAVGLGSTVVPRRGELVLAYERTPLREGGWATKISAGVLRRELRLRTWHPGDRLKSLGRPRKKVADLLAENSLDPVARKQALVLADDAGPLLIVAGAVDERALPTRAGDPAVWVIWNPEDGTHERGLS